jgi:hypothetical protein
MSKAIEFAFAYMTDEDWSDKWEDFEWYGDNSPDPGDPNVGDPVGLLACKLIELNEQTRWIPVEEGLPEIGLRVEAYFPSTKLIYIVRRNPDGEDANGPYKGGWTVEWFTKVHNVALHVVSHWRLLQPPEDNQ